MDPEQFKENKHSPAELAAEIINHQYTPPSDLPGWSFGELLLYDARTDDQPHPEVIAVILALKFIKDGNPLANSQKEAISHALEVLDAYRKESLGLQNST